MACRQAGAMVSAVIILIQANFSGATGPTIGYSDYKATIIRTRNIYTDQATLRSFNASGDKSLRNTLQRRASLTDNKDCAVNT